MRLKNIIMRLIRDGKTEDLSEKVSTIYLNNGLSQSDYEEIMAALGGEPNG